MIFFILPNWRERLLGQALTKVARGGRMSFCALDFPVRLDHV